MMKKLALGIDFGTLSARALLLDTETGEEIASKSCDYPHGILTETLPDGTELPPDSAIQLPEDYLYSMKTVIRETMREAQVTKEEIIGVGLDVTSSTVIVLDKNGRPLSEDPRFSGRMQAHMKLWRHHGGIPFADRLYQVAEERGEEWLPHYGGWLSAELFMPKAVEIAVKDPEVFEASSNILEAADWLVYVLTGEMTRSLPFAGCNSLYRYETGYPSKAYFKAAYPEAENLPDKFIGRMVNVGEIAGYVTEEAAEMFGLLKGTPVSAAHIDSHAAVLGCGASREGDMVSVIGTTANNILNGRREAGPDIPGTYSAAMDASIPGLYGYEGGQNCVGNCFQWFTENMVPAAYFEEAAKEGKNIQVYLTEKAAALSPGQSGLVALDWFNGVRTPLRDLTLKATIVGLTIRTKPEEIYRALLEAVIYGNRRIVDLFKAAGVPVCRIIAAGGIPRKNDLLMQIYADVLGEDVYICKSPEPSTRGSAILGAAAGLSLTEEHAFCNYVEKMGALDEKVFHPDPAHHEIYEKLYRQYLALSDFMAESEGVLAKLKDLSR